MNTARIIYLTLLVLIAASLINFIRAGNAFHIAKVLPFASGKPPGLYDWAGIVMILITITGTRALRRGRDDSNDSTGE